MTSAPPQGTDALTHTVSKRKLAALLAAALGLVIVFAAGLAPSEAVHNAAHDTRHSFSFPCH